MLAAFAKPQAGSVVLVAVVLLLSLHPIAGYLYLPALPELTRELQLSPETAQLTLSVLFVAFGAGQLVWGPLADRYGRKIVLIVGIGLLIAASVVATITRDATVLVLSRGVQGLGIAAAGVCARAVIRDLYPPLDNVRMLSLAFTWVGVLTLAGPPLSAALVASGGYQLAFSLLTLCAVVALAWVVLGLPETCPPPAPERQPAYRVWPRLLRDRVFLSYTALTAATYAGHFLYISLAPFVLIGSGLASVVGFGLILSLSSAVHLWGTIVCRSWLARLGLQSTLRRAGQISALGGVSMLLLVLSGNSELWAIIVPQSVYVFAHAIHQSCGQAAVTAPFPHQAATASAFSGLLLVLFGVGTAEILKRVLGIDLPGLAGAFAICALVTCAVALGPVQRYGDIATAPRARSLP